MTPNPGRLEHRYLHVGDLRRLEQMVFAPRRVVEGRFTGPYQTRQQGQSVEFRDYREYLPGDEIGAIDWKVYGRSDKLFIKLFEHQSEATVQLLVDASASMAYSGTQPAARRRTTSKYDYACQLAAAIAFLVARQHDRFSFAVAREGLAFLQPPDRTLRHLTGMLKNMERVRPGGRSGLPTTIDALSRSGQRKSLLIVFSDLLDAVDETAAALSARASYGGEAVVFHVLHPDEVRLPDVEHGTFVDSESGERVRLSVPEVRREYEERMERFLAAWAGRCRGLGIDYIRAVTGEPYYRILERYLIGRAAIRR